MRFEINRVSERSVNSAFRMRAFLAACALAATSTTATAANAPSASSNVEEMVITGSYIKGTPADAALPVSVFDAETLSEQGSPNMVELVQRVPSINGGNIGESNRFLGGQPQGTATFNMRGLGLTRTLVLLNGQRLPTINAVGADYVDINQIPMQALARVEILRDGASATYGSDAIAGVVNFITRTDFEGLKLNATYKTFADTDGDYDAGFTYGWVGERGNFMMSGSYARRNEVRLNKFDYMLPENGQVGRSSASNPGAYFTVTNPVDADGDGAFEPGTTQGTRFLDQGCAELGAFLIGTATTGTCQYKYALLEAPINDERHYSFFMQSNFDFSETSRFHVEAHWNRNIVPKIRESSSLSTILFPTPIERSGGALGGGTSPFPAVGGNLSSRYYVPQNNPGLISLMTGGGCPYAANVCAEALANGVLTSQTQWRPYAMGGNPLFDYDTDHDYNETTEMRVMARFEGEFSESLRWSVSSAYGRGERQLTWADMAVNRIQLGLRGLGGPNCNPDTGTPGVGGCLWFNPFANSITRSIKNGLSYSQATGRPQGFENTKEFTEWARVPLESQSVAQLITFEPVLSGELDFLQLPGGNVGFALGGQWRYTDRDYTVGDVYNAFATPCVDSPPFGKGLPGCTVPGVGAFAFRNPEFNNYLERDVTAFFAELKLPVLESLEVSLAVRTEDYGGNIGSTTNPRIAIRYEPFEWLVIRGSAGTTFRAPPEYLTAPGSSRFQAQFTNIVDGSLLYRAVDIDNNPDLQPEESKNYNIGFVLQSGDIKLWDTDIGAFDLSVDHYIVNFEKDLAAESQGAVYNTMFPGGTGANPAAWRCGNDALRSRFIFTSGLGVNNTVYNGQTFPDCHPNNFNAVRIKRFNGASIDVKGLDLAGGWTYSDLFGGELRIGAEASYMWEFRRTGVGLVGAESLIVDPEVNLSGKTELLGGFYSFPKWRGFGYANFREDVHNVRWTSRYTSGTEDRNAGGRHRHGHLVHDLTYQLSLDQLGLTVTATVANLFDTEPPYAISQNNYDYANISPLGRTYEIGLEYRLQQ